MGGRTTKTNISLGLAQPAHTVCEGDECSEGLDPSPTEVNVMSYTRI